MPKYWCNVCMGYHESLTACPLPPVTPVPTPIGWITEAEARRREREAFVEGAVCAEANANGIAWDYDATQKRVARARTEALRRFPEPRP